EIELADIPEVEAPLQQAHALLAQLHRITQQLELLVGFAQGEIDLRDISLQGKRYRAEARFTRLVVAARRVDAVGDATEQIYFVARGEQPAPGRRRRRIDAVRQTLRDRRGLAAGGTKARGDLRDALRLRDAQERTRLRHARRRRLEILVGVRGLGFELVQQRI